MIFTLEIAGRAVAVLRAESSKAAAKTIIEPWFLEDYLSTWSTADGVPLWDGESEMRVRTASPQECALWEEGRARFVESGQADDADKAISFLLPAGGPIPDHVEVTVTPPREH